MCPPPTPSRTLYPQCLGPKSCDLSYRVLALITILGGQLCSLTQAQSHSALVITFGKEKCWVLWHQNKVIMQTYNIVRPPLPFVPTVSQLQQTLVSIQELLVQQQQKIQELSRELSAAEVTALDHLNRM